MDLLQQILVLHQYYEVKSVLFFAGTKGRLRFIDSSSVFMIRQLCKDYGISEVKLYDNTTRDQLVQTGMRGGERLIYSVPFKIVSTHQLRVDPVKREPYYSSFPIAPLICTAQNINTADPELTNG